MHAVCNYLQLFHSLHLTDDGMTSSWLLAQNGLGCPRRIFLKFCHHFEKQQSDIHIKMEITKDACVIMNKLQEVRA